MARCDLLTSTKQLLLHHEIMLLSLRDQEGTVQSSTYLYAVAGAIATELILQRRISVGKSKRQLVEVLSREARMETPSLQRRIVRHMLDHLLRLRPMN